jgi:topoisomerase-4 subunit A
MSKKPSPNGTSDEFLPGMYKNYFLDYASYVILERAVPSIVDGLKPVQRRILHSMKQMDDGRFHKVANIIGQTMQYHPHGDAAIGDALVNMGQKDLLIEPQGNWGDVRTGDRAAASRYIEARLNKFALEVAFNPQTTDWQLSYDGRKQEPVNLPMKFPLLLAQGAEGIAVAYPLGFSLIISSNSSKPPLKSFKESASRFIPTSLPEAPLMYLSTMMENEEVG